MKANPNLWAVDITARDNGGLLVALYVCAANAGVAERKAHRHAQKLGYRAFTVSRVKHKGTIDVF